MAIAMFGKPDIGNVAAPDTTTCSQTGYSAMIDGNSIVGAGIVVRVIAIVTATAFAITVIARRTIPTVSNAAGARKSYRAHAARANHQ